MQTTLTPARKARLVLTSLYLVMAASGALRAFRAGDGIEAVVDVAVALAGGGLIYYGFVVLRERALILNIPSSKIRSVAMGLAEIKGTARQNLPLVSPLTGVACVYYRYLVEEERRSGKRTTWVTIDSGESTQPFHLEDETGRILVDPENAETILRRDHYAVKRGEGWTGRRTRSSEWRLVPGERVFVLGTVHKLRDIVQEKRVRLTQALQELKRDQGRLMTFDTDKDGQISGEEWDGAVRKVEDDLLREEIREGSERPEDELVIGKGSLETTFVIADRGEASITRGLTLKAFGALAGGFALAVVMSVSLLARAGTLPGHLAIQWHRFFD
jgi:E3 Ubiquitin ligase